MKKSNRLLLAALVWTIGSVGFWMDNRAGVSGGFGAMALLYAGWALRVRIQTRPAY